MAVQSTKKPRDYKKDIRTIHVLQRELGMADEDASALKLQLTGKPSSKYMTDAQRAKVISHLLGLRDKLQKAYKQPHGERSSTHRSASDPQDERWNKARVLWAKLHAAGAVRVNTDAALQAYVKRQTGVDAWRWLNGYQVNTVLESLKKWCARLDVDWES